MNRLVCSTLLPVALVLAVLVSVDLTGAEPGSARPNSGLAPSSQDRNNQFHPGEPIHPAASLGNAQIGRPRTGHTSLLGTGDVWGNGPYDLFLSPNRLFPCIGFDADGTPTYGPEQLVKGLASAGTVVSGNRPGQILKFNASQKRLQICEFNRETIEFVPVGESAELDVPGSIGNGLAVRFRADDSVDVYFSVNDGTPYNPSGKDRLAGRIPIIYSHLPEFIPYDGAGFWRGGMARCSLYHAHFDGPNLKQLFALQRVSEGPGEFLFDQPGSGFARFVPGEPECLVTSERMGIFRVFQVDPETGAPSPRHMINNGQHVALRHHVISPNVKMIADRRTGLSNFLVGDSGRIWFYRFTGQFSPQGSPVFDGPRPVLAQKLPLSLGALPVISPGDIDSDGLIDFMVGNDAGQLLFVKNIGKSGKPEFAQPVAVPVGGRPLDIKAGYQGSIQGPGEAMWGYTCPAVCDWNQDGRSDVILNSIFANYQLLLQEESQGGVPVFSAPKDLYCDGLQLHLAWRSQPAITTWGRSGPLCMIALDEENLLRQFWRIDDQNVSRGDLLRLQDGSPITANFDEAAGQTGRAKLVPYDWDADGALDLLIGTSRGLSFPAGNDTYLPSEYYPEHEASILLLRNCGTNESPVFEYVKILAYENERIRLGTHSCSPAFVDFGNGKQDLFVGQESGFIRFYPRSGLSAISKAN